VHVGFLTTEYPPLPSGGIGTSVRTLARSLVALGHRVTVVGWGAQAEFEDQGVRVRFLGETRVPRMGWLLHRRAARRELARLVEREGLDLVDAHDWCGPSAAISLPCPVVVHCHGSATYFAHLLGERVRPSVARAERLALTGADALVAVSRFAADVTRSLFPIEKPIEVLPNGVDVGRFRPAPPAEVEPGTLLSFGTLVRKKGVLDLGPVFSEIALRDARARLRLIGRDTPDRPTGAASTWELVARSLSPEALDRTEYVGALPPDSLEAEICRAAVCVFPSYAEALPVAWLEAMACGRPIVAYDFGWAPELIRSGVDGLLVPLGDTPAFARAVLDLFADPEWAHALGAMARARVEELFAADVVARRAAGWFSTVISRS
jgi:glycosyltransferase involved in cell wall biosynthesis